MPDPIPKPLKETNEPKDPNITVKLFLSLDKNEQQPYVDFIADKILGTAKIGDVTVPTDNPEINPQTFIESIRSPKDALQIFKLASKQIILKINSEIQLNDSSGDSNKFADDQFTVYGKLMNKLGEITDETFESLPDDEQRLVLNIFTSIEKQRLSALDSRDKLRQRPPRPNQLPK